MSQSFIVWADGTHSRDRHISPVHAGCVIDALCKEGMGGEGKVFPVAAFVVPDWATCVKQDASGHWFCYDVYAEEGRYEVICTLPIGWWTNKLFNLEK